MDYELVRSRRKTLSMTITDALTIEVRAPLHCPQKVIDDFVASHSEWIERHMALKESRMEKYGNLSDDRIICLKALAKAELPKRVEYYSNIMQLFPTSVKITSAEHRFGSCSGKNGICFSYRLMMYPPEAVDYVVVHELAHIKQKNHSKDFYRLVERYMPDYREREQLLKK